MPANPQPYRSNGVPLDIKQEGNYIAILNYIALALQSEKPFLVSLSQAAAFHQVMVTDYLCPDKTPFHVGVDFTGGFESIGAFLNRPGFNLI